LNQFTGGIVLISHDERLISAVCDEIWIVNNGQVNRWDGDFDSYKAHLMKEFAM
jgi:ATPase subunit of ABC transporter with duplicated ATPase domains